jgi:hypothetical protein
MRGFLLALLRGAVRLLENEVGVRWRESSIHNSDENCVPETRYLLD